MSHGNRSGRLVILGRGLTALAVIRNAHCLGLSPILVTDHPDIAAKSSLARTITVSYTSAEEALAILSTLADGENGLLIATSDAWLRFVVEHRLILDSQFTRVLHPDNDVLRICLEKSAFCRWCADHGIPTPAFFRPEDVTPGDNAADSASLPFPLFIRPALTRHGNSLGDIIKAREVRSPAELAHWLAIFARAGAVPILTESLLDRPVTQYSVGIARMGHDLTSFVAIKRRPSPEHAAIGTYVALAPNRDVEELARTTIERLNYFGMAEVEILHDEERGTSYVIEINARPWIQYALAYHSNHDFLRFLLDNSSYDRRAEIKTGKCWIDFNGDLFNCFSRSIGLVRYGQVGFAEYLISLAKVNVPARLSLSDLRPFWYGMRQLASTCARS